MTANPKCICTHYHSEHDDNANAKCGEGIWTVTAEVPRGDDFQIFDPCDCPGFEADPKADHE
ncbi:hypothetical protein MSTE_03577 [Mycobacteroides stephanolepidis]|uniref:Uncharacterized protein n=1 Tax=[Mycobacterium] stephanolepidis TaxID=1520670 RepID=A0A1Z4F114_9MYCO|nr:hypothetical protein [[Mycobacterium] stephanolepidis]BAX98877.1 hypothetical protein MSTE_03577 [[Mycobacterium] stephanolepidis]